MIKRLLILAILAFLLIAVPCWGANYDVSTGTTTVDGDTFCGGAACTSADTITITGGARGDLTIRDMDGSGTYITITNEAINRVVITHDDSDSENGVLVFDDCKYVDFKGNGNDSFAWTTDCKTAACYGFLIENDGNPTTPSTTVHVKGESDHIKISYVEIDWPTGASGAGSSGIAVHDQNLTSAWTFDTFEIHHNYLHDSQYAGMYFGHNEPSAADGCNAGTTTCPYVANFLIYDNLMEDLGSYGITYKGVEAGSTANEIYSNIVRVTGLLTPNSDDAKHGIGVQYFYAGAYATVYDNLIEKIVGPGIKIGEADHVIKTNTIVGSGTGYHLNSECDGAGSPYDCCADAHPDANNECEQYGHGIYVHDYDYTGTEDRTVGLYDNKIVEPVGYGIASWSNASGLMARNIITEAGVGEYYNNSSPGLVEGESASCSAAWGTLTTCPNAYQADTDSICFTTWSDDSDYSNDDFTLCCDYDYTSIAANACGVTTTPVSGVKFNGAEYNQEIR